MKPVACEGIRLNWWLMALSSCLLFWALILSPVLADEVHGVEIALSPDAQPLEGQPLTAVTVTQCNLIVAVYMTMPDATLVRFDKDSKVEAERLLLMAQTAKRNERIEVGCDGIGAAGFEGEGVDIPKAPEAQGPEIEVAPPELLEEST